MSQNHFECRHDFQPVRTLAVRPTEWPWVCRSCGAAMQRIVKANVISAPDLNLMVDSSLRCCDQYGQDDQDVKGERWIMRHATWRFGIWWFEIVYHTIEDDSFVLVFDCWPVNWPDGRLPVPDTETYRRLIGRSA